MSEETWRGLKIPRDTTKPLKIHDANGGDGILKGLCEKVHLSLGNISTYADIYTGEHAPDRTDRRLLRRSETCSTSENSTEWPLLPPTSGMNTTDPIPAE
jgi:hypothetical protein